MFECVRACAFDVSDCALDFLTYFLSHSACRKLHFYVASANGENVLTAELWKVELWNWLYMVTMLAIVVVSSRYLLKHYDLKELNFQYGQLKSEYAKLNSQVAELNPQYEELRRDHDEKVNEIRKELNKLRAKKWTTRVYSENMSQCKTLGIVRFANLATQSKMELLNWHDESTCAWNSTRWILTRIFETTGAHFTNMD